MVEDAKKIVQDVRYLERLCEVNLGLLLQVRDSLAEQGQASDVVEAWNRENQEALELLVASCHQAACVLRLVRVDVIAAVQEGGELDD